MVHVTLRWSQATILRVSLAAGLLVLAGFAGLVAHRWVSAEKELLSYRSTMWELTSMVRGMRAKAMTHHRTMQVRVDADRGAFWFASVQGGAKPYETLEETVWLPEGLQISDAPRVLTVLPTGRFSEASIVVAAPAYDRLFRLTAGETGMVQLFEEPTS